MKQYAIPGESRLYFGFAPAGAVEIIEERPSLGYIAQVDGTWVQSPAARTLAAQQWMHDELAKGFTWYGKHYQCTELDIQKIEAGVNLAKKLGETDFAVRLYDDSWHHTTISTAENLVTALQKHYRDVWLQKCNYADNGGL